MPEGRQPHATVDPRDAGTAIVDGEGRLRRWDRAFVALTGATEPGGDGDGSLLTRIHAPDRPAYGALLGRLRAGEVDAFRLEGRYAGPGGATAWRSTHVTALGDRDGDLLVHVSGLPDEAGSDEVLSRRILDGLVAFAGLLTPDGVLVQANRNALAASGIREEQVVGLPVWEAPWFAYDPQVGERLRNAVALAAGGRTVRYEERVMLGDDPSWIDFQLVPLRDDTGRVTHLVPSGVDIGAQRSVEEELRDREARLEAVLSSIDEAFCLCEVVVDDAGRPYDYRFLEVNRLFAEMTGLHDAAGRTAREMVPELEEHWFETYFRVALDGVPERFSNGSDVMGRWFDVLAIPVPPRGRFALVFTDVTARRQAEQEMRERATADAFRVALTDTLRSSPSPSVVRDRAVRLLAHQLDADRVLFAYAGDTADDLEVTGEHARPGMAPLLGLRRPRALGLPREALTAETWSGESDAPEAAVMAVSLSRTGRLAAVLVVHRAAGAAWGGQEALLVRETAERLWAALQRLEAEEALRAREAAEARARQRAELLAGTMAAIEAVDSVEERIECLAAAVVPALADVAAVRLPDELVGAPDDDAARRAGAAVSRIEVPIPLGTGAGGTLVLARTSADRPSFSLEEVALARDLAERSGVQIAKARVAEQEHAIAMRLQRALLPERIIQHPAVEIAARYMAGSAHLEVGGDWYDTYRLEGDRVGVSVGDVVGHGLESAAAMGRLRIAMATLAAHTASPATLLDRLDGFTCGPDGVGFATAAFAVLDPADGGLRYATAGHPPPLMVTPAGNATWLDGGASVPLCGIDAVRPEGVTTLPPGGLLVLYSDGLIERRGGTLTEGLERLRAAVVEAAPARDVQDVCDHVVRTLTGGPVEDDVVVLCLRRALS